MCLQLFDLTEKRALISGSSQGISLTLACGLAATDATVDVLAFEASLGPTDTQVNTALMTNPEFPAERWGNVEGPVDTWTFPTSDASSFVNGPTAFVGSV